MGFPVNHVLDCGCVLYGDGRPRSWCPTCADGGPRGNAQTPQVAEQRKASVTVADRRSEPVGSIQIDDMRMTLGAIRTVRAGIATEGTSLTVDHCIALANYFDANRRYLCGEEAVEKVADALDEACGIIELGDNRLLASDGPAGNQPPDLSLEEWGQLYTTLDRARTQLRRTAVNTPTECADSSEEQ